MKLNTVFIANATLCALFGVGFLAAPAMQFATFGGQSSPLAEMVARVYGASLLGYAITSWLARKAEPSSARNGIVVGNILFHLVGAGMLMTGMRAGTINAIGGLAVVLSLLLALGFVATGLVRANAASQTA